MSLYLSNHVCYPLCALVLQSTRMKTRHCLTPSQAASQEEDHLVSSSSCFCVGLRRSHERKPSYSRRSSLPSAGAMALSACPHLIRLRRGWVIGLAGDQCSVTFHHHCFSFSFSRSFVCEVELMSHTDTRAQQPTLTPVRPALHCPALPCPLPRLAAGTFTPLLLRCCSCLAQPSSRWCAGRSRARGRPSPPECSGRW